MQTPTEYMIANALTKPKALQNYASAEANRLGVYQLPIQLGSRGCLKLYLHELTLCPSRRFNRYQSILKNLIPNRFLGSGLNIVIN